MEHNSMMAEEPLPKRPKQESNRRDDTSKVKSVDASFLISLLFNSLAQEDETTQHSSVSWSKQKALDICLEAVDLLKSQMKSEGYISCLPSWIKCSEFVKQYQEDFPEEEVLQLDDMERLFELPIALCEDSVVKVMDNIRYFGISDDSLAMKQLFEYYLHQSNHHNIQSQKASFPELKVLWDNVEFTIKAGDENQFTAIAAQWNFLLALRYAHENGYPWNESTCSGAAINGRLDCLKYAHKNGCPWNEETCSYAAQEGHLNCLKYAHDNGCPWNQEACSGAAYYGHLDCLKYAHENGCPWDEETCSEAAYYGHLECLKYAHKNGCPWNKATCFFAAEGGQVDCLKYAHDNGCPWNELTCSCAAALGRLDCLKYAYENGCPWDEETCSKAAEGGHLDCLKYAHENACLWNEKTCSQAAKGGHLDCLKYAHENACPWDEETCSKAAEGGHLDCLKYFNENN